MAITLAFALFFSIWFVLSVFAQFDGPLVERLQAADELRLLPRWTFFAPTPGSTDYYVIYRDHLDDAVTPWRELPFRRPRSRWRFLWHPHKRYSKAVTDFVQTMTLVSAAQGERAGETLPFTLPYVALLNIVSAAEPAPDGAMRQFAIVEKRGYLEDGPPRPVMTSAAHPLLRSVRS